MQLNKSKSFTKKIGQIPGSLTYTGEKEEKESPIRLIKFNAKEVFIHEEFAYQDVIKNLNEDFINWIHFYSLHRIEAIEKIGEHFDIHNLMLEDTLNVEHLPKVEFSENHIFFTLKILKFDQDNFIDQEHVSFVLGKNYLISLKEQKGELLKPIRDRIINNMGKVRFKNADYLFYLLIDTIVDNYFLLLDKFRDIFENLEDDLIENPNKNYINEIHHIKKQVLIVRKYILTLREAINNLINEEPNQISDSNYKYLRDIQDHVHFVYESIESFREDQNTLMELNSSNQSNNMNQVMKILTIVATIFIPLTFIAGIYGMNFQNMPELSWSWGYFAVLGVMASVTALMIWFMKRKRWL